MTEQVVNGRLIAQKLTDGPNIIYTSVTILVACSYV